LHIEGAVNTEQWSPNCFDCSALLARNFDHPPTPDVYLFIYKIYTHIRVLIYYVHCKTYTKKINFKKDDIKIKYYFKDLFYFIYE